MGKKYLSIGEAAEVLGVSVDTLRRWEKEGLQKNMTKLDSLGHEAPIFGSNFSIYVLKFGASCPTSRKNSWLQTYS